MSEHKVLKTVVLAAAIALAMGSTSVMAADPAANALPGQGHAAAGVGTATIAVTGGINTLSIPLTADAVITWKNGTAAGDINPTGAAGFNIGSKAAVKFTGAFDVLNVDSTGNASQIFGALDSAAGNVFVANGNGIIVGAEASISSTTGDVGLIANTLDSATAPTFAGTAASLVYNGTGGDVTVAKGAGISGTSVLISGGGTVNVDLGKIAGTVDLLAGVPSNIAYDVPNNSFTTTGGFSAINANAALNLAGELPAGSTFKGGAALVVPGIGIYTVGGLVSGGDITNRGIVDASNAATVAAGGTLTNKGDFIWGLHGSMTPGNVANHGSMNLTGSIDLGGSLSNRGEIIGPANVVLTHGLDNFGSIAAALIQSEGDFTNSGKVTTGASGAALLTYPAAVTVIGGNFFNSGELNSLGGVSVTNGSLSNSGLLTTGPTAVSVNLLTRSDDTLSSFSKTGAYSIDNTGTIISTGDLLVNANLQLTANGSTGSITNSGMLLLGPVGSLGLAAHDDVSLAGTVKTGSGTTYKALSAANPLDALFMGAAGGGLGGPGFATAGVATVATDIVTTNPLVHTIVLGNQVKLMGNLSSVDAAGDPVGTIRIIAGAKSDTDYAVRVAAGKTVSALEIYVDGAQASDNPNVILQGTMAAQNMGFGTNTGPVSDVYTGPGGSLSLFKVSTNPVLGFNFTGGVKTVPYNNTPSNFRYNGLNVVTDGSPLGLDLNPVAYTTNGTSNGKSAVNILVNSDVSLGSTLPLVAPVAAGGTAVTGVTKTPNTHLVLQSSGDISTTSGDFYWPGYVYLGTVDKDADGNALPGTLSAEGTITLTGNFNNVLPGDVAGASGIHFMSGNALAVTPVGSAYKVTTNANAWINFPTDLLSQGYARGFIGNPTFFGGTAAGLVVTYDALDAENFHTHPVDASK